MFIPASRATALTVTVGLWSTRFRFARTAMAAVLALCVLHSAAAQQRSAAFVYPYTSITLKKINASGVITIGHRENSRVRQLRA